MNRDQHPVADGAAWFKSEGSIRMAEEAWMAVVVGRGVSRFATTVRDWLYDLSRAIGCASSANASRATCWKAVMKIDS